MTKQDQENYHLIRKKIDRLRTLVEKSELWVSKQRESRRRKGSFSLDSMASYDERPDAEVRVNYQLVDLSSCTAVL